jgi:hypothetical protein
MKGKMQMSHFDNSESSFNFYHFGLIVTGKGERDFLPELLRELERNGQCKFKVIRKIGQRSPITSSKKLVKMVGTGKKIPTKDETDIGIPARRYLSGDCDFVLLIDDLEHDRRQHADQVFARYRDALDLLLGNLKNRASVHFLVNMLEAYYFADPAALNSALGTSLTEYDGDVEAIRHPKNDLKRIKQGFHELRDGRKILEKINMTTVLSRPHACASLRTLFAWCTIAMKQPLSSKFCLDCGIYSLITGHQIGNI